MWFELSINTKEQSNEQLQVTILPSTVTKTHTISTLWKACVKQNGETI